MTHKERECMVNRVSALEGHYRIGSFNKQDDNSILISEIKNLKLNQLSVWFKTLENTNEKVEEFLGEKGCPKFGKSITVKDRSVFRIEPLKFWFIGGDMPHIPEDQGHILDLSHSRILLSISGKNSSNFLKRFLPIDLRENSFPINSVASTSFHHVGVTICRYDNYFGLLIPRAFALSLWQILIESAEQFGYEIS